ncbi:MAG: hypothetical protein LBJ11_07970 [Oscillospiraceae bacterium]|jgi:alpha-mannosidase|nr:hypothetical protein [Oscillospiraceae bacterium]
MEDLDRYAAARGSFAAVRLEDLRPTAADWLGRCAIHRFLTLGAFVLETGGTLETEYFYQRHKVLEEDYLASSGGEAAAVPLEHEAVRNDYWGPEQLRWQPREAGDELRFRHEDRALFVTEQRNCVQYVAFYVDCPAETRAVISWEDSGAMLLLNGERIASYPYGRVKGMPDLGRQAAVTFRPGMNLVLFKIRVGYVADRIDIVLTHCAVYPILASSGNLGIAGPLGTQAYYAGDPPRQIFPLFAGAFGDSPGGTVSVSAAGWEETLDIPPLANGSCAALRPGVPAGELPAMRDVQVRLTEPGAAPAAGSFLAETRPFQGIAGTEHIFSDFHFDTTYHQEQRLYALGAFHITKANVEELRRNPRFAAILSEVDYLHPFYTVFPDTRAALREAFLAGQAEADCFYNQPNELTSSGEGLVRNLAYGQIYHRDVLGRIAAVYAPGDVFGHPNQMSQICRKGGCRAAMWGKYVVGLDCLFHHVSPDGAELLHLKSLSAPDAKRLGLRRCGGSSSAPGQPEVYPRTGDSAWMDRTASGAKFSVFSAFMDGARDDEAARTAETGRSQIEYTARDLTAHHAGVLLTRTDFKQANRLAENLLITAEKFAAVAAWYGAAYPEKALDKAWRQLLCAQHHDSVTGTNNEISFVDLMIEYREAVDLAAEMVRRAAGYLASGVAAAGESTAVVFNPHPWERREPCELTVPADVSALEDGAGARYPLAPLGNGKAAFVPRVPGLGYATYRFAREPADPPNGRETPDRAGSAADYTIENEFFRVTADPAQGGGIVSIFDKSAGREVLKTGPDGPANRIAVLKEIPNREETQHEFYTTGHKLFSSDFPARVARESGPVFARLVSTVRLGTVARARQEVTLWQGVRRIDCKTVIEDYQDRDDLFTVTFPVDVAGGRPVYEDRFAPHVCGEGREKLSFRTHQCFMYSHCQVAPSVNWFDYGPTVTLRLGAGQAVHIGSTALIRPEDPQLIDAGTRLLQTLAKKAIPVTPYADVTQRRYAKIIHYNEDLRGTDTRFVLSLEGIPNEYEQKLLALAGEEAAGAFQRRLGLQGSACLFLRDSDNAWGKPIDVLLLKAAGPEGLDALLRSAERQLAAGKTWAPEGAVLAARPGEPADYGVAILNRGTIACSAEPGQLLNMMLFHTAETYGNAGKVTGGAELIPERKTHAFTYALLPHAGDYRDARLFRAGQAFNDSLFAVTEIAPATSRPLPAEKSFLTCDPNFTVTSLKAGGYPLAAMRAEHGTLPQRGFALRGFESDGVPAETEIRCGFPLTRAEGVNLLEEDPRPVSAGADGFRFRAEPHAIETFRLFPGAPEGTVGPAELGPVREPVEPTYLRSWEHDLGSMPMGYLAAAASLGRDMTCDDGIHCRFRVCLANNHPDRAIAGEVRLLLPEGFRADRTALPYQAGPRGTQVIPVAVTKPSADARGVFRLAFEHDGQCFEDIYEFGAFLPEIRLEADGDGVTAFLHNPTDQPLHGELSLATPFETWDAGGFNPSARGNAGPRTAAVELPAGGRTELRFPIISDGADDLFDSWWAAAKLMVNGRIFFGYAARQGPAHFYVTNDFHHVIAADGGSLRQLLEMEG